MLPEANPGDVEAATKCFGQVASAASGLNKLKPLAETVTFNAPLTTIPDPTRAC